MLKLAQQSSTPSRVPQIPFSSDFINLVIQNFIKMKDFSSYVSQWFLRGMPRNGFYQLVLQTQLPLAWGSMGCWLCKCTALYVYLKASFCLGCLDLLGFVFFSWFQSGPSQRMSCKALQACVLAGIASQNIKGQCCYTQLLLLLSVCQFQDDLHGLLLSLQPPMQVPYLCL